MTKTSSEPKIPALAPTLLLILALAESLLALYQWMELVVVRSGGSAVCALSATVNCTAVWNSGFASRIHELLKVPVAGLGLIWGLTAFGLALVLSHRMATGKAVRSVLAGLQVTAAVGALSCISFAVGSYNAGAVCLTCLATFALVLTFAGVAYKLLPGPFPSAHLQGGLGWAGGLALGFYLALLYPGMATPTAKGTGLAAKLSSPQGGQGGDDHQGHVHSSDPAHLAADFLKSLSWAEQQAVSDILKAYRASPPRDVRGFPTRALHGSAGAPMKVVDFTDVRCGHCRSLVEIMEQLHEALPPGRLSVEARHFPLDGECNKEIQRTDGSGISCTGAKALICLEGAPDFWQLRRKVFSAQESLTKEKILQIASSGSVSREKLNACVASPETQGKLNQDIAYAMMFQPEGTPLVLVNGKEGSPAGAWLYAMGLAGGDPNSAAFAGLPPPK